MRSIIQRLILFGIVATIMGCFDASSHYRGDGQFTDRGWMAYDRRYSVDLGPVNLTVPYTYSYKLRGLPHAEFNVGIDIVEEKPIHSGGTRLNHPARVRLELRTSDGQTVIREEGSLNSWVWSYAEGGKISRLYLSGEGKDISIPGGGTKGERVGEKASGGWGTYFNSEPRTTYFLKLEILSSDIAIERPARLIVDGWDRN